MRIGTVNLQAAENDGLDPAGLHRPPFLYPLGARHSRAHLVVVSYGQPHPVDRLDVRFAGFDPHQIAEWGEADVTRLLGDPGIIRHRGKIEAAITNARAWQELEAREGFDSFMWRYVDGVPLQPGFATQAEVPPKTALSEQVSKDLKKAGFKFCGPTITYAWMEACGLVNDHILTCHRHGPCAAMAR